MTLPKILGVSIAAVALLAVALLAQNDGSITGTVKDSKGGIIPGATVSVSNPALAINQTAQTNGEGIFFFPQLPANTANLIPSLTFNGIPSIRAVM